mgnify:CR=1 FL=1
MAEEKHHLVAMLSTYALTFVKVCFGQIVYLLFGKRGLRLRKVVVQSFSICAFCARLFQLDRRCLQLNVRKSAGEVCWHCHGCLVCLSSI